MNANELADELENTYPFVGVMEVAATMLRNQQAEIEALKQIIDANNLNQNIGQFVKPTNEPVAWKAYEEVHFNDQYILRWVREGDEYVNKITKEMMEDLKSVVRQQQAELDRAVELYTDKAIENEALRMMLANRNDALDKLELK